MGTSASPVVASFLPHPSSPYGSAIPYSLSHSLFEFHMNAPSPRSSERGNEGARAMKGNTKSCITSHRCSDHQICNRCSLDPIRLLLRVHSPPPYILHKAQSGGDGGGESLGRELMIIKPNAVNVVMVPAAVGSAAHITPTHSLTY